MSRLSSQRLACTCATGAGCAEHCLVCSGLGRVFAGFFPVGWAEVNRLLGQIGGGRHSFRRTAALSLRQEWGAEVSADQLRRANLYFGWSVSSREFLHYSRDFGRFCDLPELGISQLLPP